MKKEGWRLESGIKGNGRLASLEGLALGRRNIAGKIGLHEYVGAGTILGSLQYKMQISKSNESPNHGSSQPLIPLAYLSRYRKKILERRQRNPKKGEVAKTPSMSAVIKGINERKEDSKKKGGGK